MNLHSTRNLHPFRYHPSPFWASRASKPSDLERRVHPSKSHPPFFFALYRVRAVRSRHRQIWTVEKRIVWAPMALWQALGHTHKVSFLRKNGRTPLHFIDRPLWMCSRLLSIAACTTMKLEWTIERIWSRILPLLVHVFRQTSGASFKVSGGVVFVESELNCVAFK